MELSAVDQGGLLDLNAAPFEMIAGLLSSAGLDGETARRVAGAIVDFRDENDVPEAGGASEAALYREAGRSYGPRNGPFLDADEIAQLPALGPELAARLRPLVTVFNPRPALDLAVMDRRARALLPRETKGLPALERWRGPSEARAFAVEAVLRRSDGTPAAARHAVAAFGSLGADGAPAEGIRPEPPRLHEWREFLASPEAPAAPPAAGPLCERLRRALEGET